MFREHSRFKPTPRKPLGPRPAHSTADCIQDAEASRKGSEQLGTKARIWRIAAALIETVPTDEASEQASAAKAALSGAGLIDPGDTPASLQAQALDVIHEEARKDALGSEILEGQAARFMDRAERQFEDGAAG